MDSFISNTAQVKSHNEAIIKNVLASIEYGTKNMVSGITGLSVATCNTILNELAASGEIIEITNDTGNTKNAGRPAKAYRYNEKYAFACCMMLLNENGKKSLHYAVVDLLGNIVAEEKLDKVKIDYDEIKNILTHIVKKYQKIKVIGMGIPGIISRDFGIDTCDIEELNGFPLGDELKKDFGMSVVMDNDMNMTAYGFYRKEEYDIHTSFAAVSFFENIGPGTGIIVEGKIIRGNTNFAGEVSYLPIENRESDVIKLPVASAQNIVTIAKIICSIAAIINPKAVMLTGKSVDEGMVDDIYSECKKLIPEKHVPKIYFVYDTMPYYIKGLSTMALEKLNNLA